MKLFAKVFVFFCLILSLGSMAQGSRIALADDTISITGAVMGPPVKPVISGIAICENNKLSIRLDWPTDENSKTFDVKRNGALLVTGLINSDYEDIDVSTGISNIYQVIAHGPMGPGSATSDEITVSTTAECSTPKPPINQEIQTLENKSIDSYNGTPKITERAPLFSGKTNIPNAKIEIAVEGSPKVYQTIFANINGFWSWKVPEDLDIGSHTIFVTAIDPDDPMNKASSSLNFVISKRSSDNNNHNRNNGNNNPNPALPAIPQESELLTNTSENPPFQMTVEVENFNHIVFAGEDLSLRVDFSKKASFLEDKDYQVFYEVIDKNNKTIYIDVEYVNIFREKELNKKIPLSALATLGDYRIRVKAYDGKNLLAGENYFIVKELPLFNIGFCTLSLTQILQNFAWLIILILLALWFLLAAERNERKKGIYDMTEDYLRRSGFFSKKND
jgi:hypothetical protein